jgi:hypothetical protein
LQFVRTEFFDLNFHPNAADKHGELAIGADGYEVPAHDAGLMKPLRR